MTKRILKTMLAVTGGTLGIMIIVLCIHIYMVTRPKAPDANTRIMARIDFKQDITQSDADRITAWLNAQEGVTHVLCNPESNIAVFTFAPVKANANDIVSRLNGTLPYTGTRYMPSEEEMKQGCPVAVTSTTYKILSFFKHS